MHHPYQPSSRVGESDACGAAPPIRSKACLVFRRRLNVLASATRAEANERRKRRLQCRGAADRCPAGRQIVTPQTPDIDATGVAYPVVHDAKNQQFDVVVGGDTATLKYVLGPGVIDLQHTSVPDAMRGLGVANALSRAALEYARAAKLKVIPTCPFVRTYLQRHPQYADLVLK